MPREERMFRDVVDPSIKVGSRQPAAVLLTVVLEAALLSAVAVVSLMAVDVLPAPREAIDAFVVQPPTPEVPPAVRPDVPREPVRPPVNHDAAPIEPPRVIAPEVPRLATFEPPPDVVVAGGDLGGVFGTGGAGLDVAPPPAPPPAAPLRVGGTVRRPEKTRDAAPVYPEIARSARVQGTVIIEATIDRTGRVTDARVLRGHPLLDGAALDAVREWEFMPTLLNGVPTPVIMTVTVNFRLS